MRLAPFVVQLFMEKRMELFSSAWLSALLAIVLIDLVLAGDNAIVIALAARNLPSHLQKRAIVWGTVGATCDGFTSKFCDDFEKQTSGQAPADHRRARQEINSQTDGRGRKSKIRFSGPEDVVAVPALIDAAAVRTGKVIHPA